jgi:hypothetical protein
MSQEISSPPAPLCGRPINALFGASNSEQKRRIDLLDNALPLRGASHADVAEYRIETPIRYAECVAILTDGRRARLLKAHQFVGWTSHAPSRSLLFRNGEKHVELVIDARLQGEAPGGIRDVLLEPPAKSLSSVVRKFIGINGDLFTLPALPGAIHA